MSDRWRVYWFVLGWLVTVVVLIFAIFVIASGHARAAEPAYCQLYSREMLRAFVRNTAPEALPAISMETLSYHLTKYWSHCILQDDSPVIKDLATDGQFVGDIWAQVHREAQGVVPASGPPSPDPSVAPPSKPATAPLSYPERVCAKAHLHVVWKGKSWRCRK